MEGVRQWRQPWVDMAQYLLEVKRKRWYFHTVRDFAVFYFFIFLFPFFIKIYFRFENLQKYTPAAPLPGGRDLAGRLPGGRGLPAKKRQKKFADGSLGTGRPAAGRPASQAARLGGGWPPPLYKGVGCPSPFICLAKNLERKKRKEREGGRGGVRERQSGEALPDFQAGDYRKLKFSIFYK